MPTSLDNTNAHDSITIKQDEAGTTEPGPSQDGSADETNGLTPEQRAVMETFQRDSDDWLQDPFQASPNSKYKYYQVPVEHEEGDRAMEIQLRSWKRPHMRALHCAWISFFLAFAVWFAPSPLLVEIQSSLSLSKKQVWNSNITNDITAIIMRIIIGPVCDAHGARIPMAVVLVLSAIPCSMLGLVNTGAGLAVLRFFIGIAGSSFVMAQFWPSRMFSREIAGTANGIVGGWGNLGGAFTQVFMGSILFPLFKNHVYDNDAEKAWRTICVIPSAMALIWGLTVAFISDDAPMGNYREMRRKGTMDRILFTTSLRSGAKINTWILYIQYACSFGVEIVMNNARYVSQLIPFKPTKFLCLSSVLYFTSEFGMSTEDASILGFAFGSLNIFARGCGGFVSDRLNLSVGLRGRLWLILALLLLEGALIVAFAFSGTLTGSIVTMCLFSMFTQAAEGAIYGVVPYVSRLYTGSVSGLVGAGGNVGSVVFALGFRSLSYKSAFIMMGSIVMASSFLSVFINIPCHARLLSGEDNHAVIRARERFKKRRQQEFLDQSVRRHSMFSQSAVDVELNVVQAAQPDLSVPQSSAPTSGSKEDEVTVNAS